jgi:hypothetical protein
MKMEPVSVTTTAACPPHHWLIGNEISAEGTVERWTCQRCDATRERVISRRRLQPDARRQYVGEADDAISAFLGRSGERVA